ncbi:MAG TPA: DUF4412 domain-containing protein [Thermoanaerobaculia bacterium]|jgi:hypothetical protein|nr:DUF4412 domain-containing protein [Thermoanaerobaculia bacterium]
MPNRRLLLPLLLLLGAPAAADSLLTLRSSIEGLKMDQPRSGEVTIWIGTDRLRRDEADSSYILRLDLGKLYIVNHADKTYKVLAVPGDLEKIAAQSAAQIKVHVTATSETKKIGEWTARKYKVDLSNPEGLHLDTTIWTSKDIASHEAYSRLTASLAALQPGASEWARKLEQIEGFPVLQEASVDMAGSRFKTREELVSIETKDAPAGAYDLPAGYTPQPFVVQ